jgi:nicotinate-nucleotide adenylyltransferase
MTNIVIFGGVFDPPHIGHLAIYKAVLKHMKVNKFIVVPSKIPPLKSHQPIASPIDRINMTKLLFKPYKNVTISDYEISAKSDEASYTIDTVRYFHKKYPTSQLYIVVGTDRYLDFKQ